MLAPVVVFVYNRLDSVEKSLYALNNNLLASDTEVYIFSDGPKDNSVDDDKVNKVREYLRKFKGNNNFKNVELVMSEKNKGLSNSIIEGVTQIINKYGKVIVLEDDLITNYQFIKFMNDCLDFYEENPRVWSASGTTLDLESLKDYHKSVYACYRVSSWGWATWKDRWNKVDWEVSDYNVLMHDRKLQKEFQKQGEDILIMLKRQHEGKIDSWAVRWSYQQFKENMITILPTVSLIENIGFDGRGTNCSGVKPDINMEENKKFDYVLEDADIDDNIMKEYQRHYTRTFATKVLDFFGIKWRKKG